MAINHSTLLLDQGTWDFCLDALGNIAVASAPYAIAQDVASQCKAFVGECWYDNTQGVPYWQQILGRQPPASLIVSDIESQALLVPDVATATATVGGVTKARASIGQLLITDTDGNAFAFPL